MATEKVLALGPAGIEEKEITTGGGGGSSVLKGSDWVNWCYNSMASSFRFRTDKKDYGSGVCFFFPIRNSEFTGVISLYSGAGYYFTAYTAGAGVSLPIKEALGLGITTGTAVTTFAEPTLELAPGLPDKDVVGTKQRLTDLEDILVEIKIRTPAALSTSTQTYTVNTYILFSAGTGLFIGLGYTHNVNSGKWLLTYVTEAISTITVDTGITVAANTDYTARFRTVWNPSTSKFEATVSIGAYSVVLTDLRMNATLSVAASIRGQVVLGKPTGTTATVLRLRDACVIVGLK